MRNLLNEARKHYDWIIVDSPPLVAVSDAILMAPHCDGSLVVLRSESTPCRVAMIALDVLSRRVKPPVGAVLNALDLRSGYYPSYGYYRYQSAHYTYGYDSALPGGRRKKAKAGPRDDAPAAEEAKSERG
jgi:Mrp family chromosome partitioning ATPase